MGITPAPRHSTYIQRTNADDEPLRISSVSPIRTAGGINERGFLNDMKKTGFTDFNSLCELIANSIDANSDKIIFVIDDKNIKIIDNGDGMNSDKLVNMFEMFRQNHSEESVIGISGKGAKPSTLKLSREREVIVYSCDGQEYIKAIVPWNEMINQGKYEGMIKIIPMNESEIDSFKSQNEGSKGTTIIFPYDEEVHTRISFNFDDERYTLPMCERFDVIFGRQSHMEIELVDNVDPTKNTTLKLYDYFSLDNAKYYQGKNKYYIKIYEHKNKKRMYVLENNDQYLQFKTTGRGISKKPDETPIIPKGYKCVGEYIIEHAMMKNPKVFDEQNPKELNKETIGSDLGDYDNKFFNTKNRFDSVKEEFAKCQIYRNNQMINIIPIEEFKHSSARSDVNLLVKICYLRTCISYYTPGNQDNILDEILGIQSNKNQLNIGGIPTELKRFITYTKKKAWDDISGYFNTLINNVRRKKEVQKLIEKKAIEDKLKVEQAILAQNEILQHYSNDNSASSPTLTHARTPSPEPVEVTRVSASAASALASTLASALESARSPSPSPPSINSIEDTTNLEDTGNSIQEEYRNSPNIIGDKTDSVNHSGDETDEYQISDNEDSIDSPKDRESKMKQLIEILSKKSDEEFEKIYHKVLEIC